MDQSQPPQEPSSAQPSTQASVPERSGRRIGRKLQVIGLLVVLVVAGAVAFVGQGLLSGTPTATSANKTVWQNITAGIRDTGVPKDVALEAFAYIYHVSIPGVTLPQGVAGGDAPTSGTGAVSWVKSHWDELTSEQQAVINPFITPGPNDVVIPIDLSAGAMAAPKVVLAAAHLTNTDAAGGTSLDAPAPGLEAAMKAELIADIKTIGARLGMPTKARCCGRTSPSISARRAAAARSS